MIRTLQKADINRVVDIWLDFIKSKKVKLCLNVYQKNMRAIHFYQREGFKIQHEGIDEATGEKDYTMIW